MGRKIARDKRLGLGGEMPPLYHTLPGEQYDPKKSQVLKWISEYPELLAYVFDKLAQSGQIVYDQDTGRWQGVGYDGN